MSESPAPPARDDDAPSLAERCVARMLAHDAFSAWLGLEVVHVAPRAADVRLVVRPEMLNGFGVGHGGIAFALADSALAFASNTRGHVTMSIDNAISYLAPVRVGDVLTAQAREEGDGRRVGFFRVVVQRQDGDTVAIFRGTVYETGRPLLDHSDDRTDPIA